MDAELAPASFGFAAVARSAGARASVYLGSSGKLGRQLKWASDAGARFCLIYGRAEQAEGRVTIRDMASGDQTAVPAGGTPVAADAAAGDVARRRGGRAGWRQARVSHPGDAD